MEFRTGGRRGFPLTRSTTKGYQMNLSRHMATVGLVAVSLSSFGALASPALAKGGGDINNTVISISPNAPLPVTNSGGGGGGGGKPAQCFTVSIDPVTGVGTGVCTTNRV